MTHVVRTRILTFCLAAIVAGPAFSQTFSTDAVSEAVPAASHVAYVYVGTTKGVNLYDVASNGKLTLVSGSPFSIAGSAAGSNGKYFLSLGTDFVHSYSIASNGAIKAQVSQINTQSYNGAECGSTNGAVLDHTGQHLLVMLDRSGTSPDPCVAFQAFDIVASSGALIFNDSSLADGNDYPPAFTLPTIAANGAYAFGQGMWDDYQERTSMQEFALGPSGALLLATGFAEVDPQAAFNWQNYPLLEAADPANHLAVTVYPLYMPSFGPSGENPIYGNIQLASYTVDSAGNPVSTNTWQNMPTPAVSATSISMSRSGQLLAVAGSGNGEPLDGWTGTGTNGLQIFHFNGANPITPYSKTLITVPIDQMQWDNNDHLYALSDSTHKLYVYTVTPTAITAVPGSPYTISATPNALIVVPTLCNAPSTDGVNICSPASESTVGSPVLVEATATVTGTIVSTQLWVDGVKNFNAPGSTTLTTSVTLAAGTHRFAVIATNTAGQKWESTVTATVK